MINDYNPDKINPDVYYHGETVAVIGWDDKEKIEQTISSIRTLTGQMVDWSYVAGRAVVKSLGDAQLTRDALKQYRRGDFRIVESDGSWE